MSSNEIDFSCYIRSINEEIDELKKEINAISDFVSRIIDIRVPKQTNLNDFPKSINCNNSNSNKIQRIYKETFMSVNHFNQEYGNNWKKDMCEEFGKDVVDSIIHSNQITRSTKQTIIISARESQKRRIITLSDFKKEKKRINNYQGQLEKIGNNINKLKNTNRNRNCNGDIVCVSKLKNRCEGLIEKRQHEIIENNKKTTSLKNGEVELYIYSDCPTSYPVLNTTLEYIKELEIMGS